MNSNFKKNLDWLKYINKRTGIRGLIAGIKCLIYKKPITYKAKNSKIKFPFFMRVGTSDIPTYEQIFINKEYNAEVNYSPITLIDAGANIGLAAIFFANRFPNAKIIAIEPEESNFAMLKMNSQYYQNIIPIQAALWNKNEEIELVDPGYGHWGFMTQDKDENTPSLGKKCHRVSAITIDRLMSDQKIDVIDILKIDIEGAEREVFQDCSAWITKVDSIIIELHEIMKQGCEQSFFNAIEGFGQPWQQGENIYITRNNGCLKQPSF